MLLADPGDVADFLQRSHALPDLHGIRVVFSGLGDTSAPQERLSHAQRENLVAIWRAVATKAGADVDVLDTPLSEPAQEGLPDVTPVDVTVPKPQVPRGKISTIALGEGSVRFRPGTATYADPETVRSVLAPLAERIITEGLRVRLTGATASSGSQDYRMNLSRARADTVKASLVSAGVPADRITTRGVGSSWPQRVPDLDAKGNLLPGPAARNRLVILELAPA
jgi:outer membrane protein OmpA-like peptidoglycan-associated protein